MKNSANVVLGSLIGDAMALGPHWIYDQTEISKKLGRPTYYQPPLAVYHKGKSAGDLTHYGDQIMVLLRSISGSSGFDLTVFAADWRRFWEDPATVSYCDGATKATLARLKSDSNPSSTSSDIAGAGRIGPLFLLEWKDDEELLSAAKIQTEFTHGNPMVIESALFFTKVILALQSGLTIPNALKKAMEESQWEALPTSWFENAEESAASSESDPVALQGHGLSCNTEDAFPGICHLLLRYPEDPETALIENACSGGDSAARGTILGMVYGAVFPESIWPVAWVSELHAKQEAEQLIAALP